jgi:hypothetical protein
MLNFNARNHFKCSSAIRHSLRNLAAYAEPFGKFLISSGLQCPPACGLDHWSCRTCLLHTHMHSTAQQQVRRCRGACGGGRVGWGGWHWWCGCVHTTYTAQQQGASFDRLISLEVHSFTRQQIGQQLLLHHQQQCSTCGQRRCDGVCLSVEWQYGYMLCSVRQTGSHIAIGQTDNSSQHPPPRGSGPANFAPIGSRLLVANGLTPIVVTQVVHYC